MRGFLPTLVENFYSVYSNIYWNLTVSLKSRTGCYFLLLTPMVLDLFAELGSCNVLPVTKIYRKNYLKRYLPWNFGLLSPEWTLTKRKLSSDMISSLYHCSMRWPTIAAFHQNNNLIGHATRTGMRHNITGALNDHWWVYLCATLYTTPIMPSSIDLNNRTTHVLDW